MQSDKVYPSLQKSIKISVELFFVIFLLKYFETLFLHFLVNLMSRFSVADNTNCYEFCATSMEFGTNDILGYIKTGYRAILKNPTIQDGRHFQNGRHEKSI